MIRLFVISFIFQKREECKRWMDLASAHKDLDITLIAPKKFQRSKFGSGEKYYTYGFEMDDGNFHVRTVEIEENQLFGWTSDEMIDYIRKEHPDVVYHIGAHLQASLMQLLDYKKTYHSKEKILCFSMRGPVYNIDNLFKKRFNKGGLKSKITAPAIYLLEKSRLQKLNKYCDAVFCHYPDAVNCFRKEGYKGPIYMQTQVGVDTDIFHVDSEIRAEMREKLSLGDSYVFVSAVREFIKKGIIDVLNALPDEGNWKYVIMGTAPEDEIQTAKSIITRRNLEEKVILTGFIDPNEMNQYLNAADCLIHYVKTTDAWVETFSVTLVQAMALRLPVIGSDSGSVPYQVGPDGIIVPENDLEELRNKIKWVLDYPREAHEMGEKLYCRTVSSFSTSHLNELFYQTILDIVDSRFDERKTDMTYEWNKRDR